MYPIRQRLQRYYEDIVRNDLIRTYQYRNTHEIPEIDKIVLNMSIKDAIYDKKMILPGLIILEMLTGQRAVVTKAKKSISNFKLRKESPIGIQLTLRKESLYLFLDILVFITLPRIRDLTHKYLNQQQINTSFQSYSRYFPQENSTRNKGSIEFVYTNDFEYNSTKGKKNIENSKMESFRLIHSRKVQFPMKQIFNGQVSFGFKPSEILLFPQIEREYDRFYKAFGMDVTLVFKARQKLMIHQSQYIQMQIMTFLSAFQLPFKEHYQN